MKVKIIKKKVKNITLRIKEDCQIVLTAPPTVSDEYIQVFLKEKENWIREKITIIQSRKKRNPEKKFISGEYMEYLGKNYILKVIKSRKNSVKIEGEYFCLYVNDTEDFKLKKMIAEKWFMEKTKSLFLQIIEKYEKIVKKQVTKLRLKKMKTRWGSCNHVKGYVNLNTELIKKRKECIEYVVFHELTHLIYPNHSNEFYNYIGSYMPDWEKRKNLLKNNSF